MSVDPIALTADLIRCPSVTPIEGGALQLLDKLLSEAGFETWRGGRAGTPNLYARWGARGANKSFGFNGHTDVVPVGDEAAWTVDPFGAEIRDGILYGRGATDMKSGVAAFAAAAVDFVTDTPPDGAVILAITGDEEGPATDGTTALLDWMQENGEAMTACLVGEPTCPNTMGEMIKVGRRGSLTAHFTVTGKQGHAAYPHRAVNPLPAMARLVDRLASHELDQGSDHFDPSTGLDTVRGRRRGRRLWCSNRHGVPRVRGKLSDPSRCPVRSGECRRAGRNRHNARTVHDGRNVGRAVCERPLSGGGMRSCGQDHASGR